MKTFTYNDGGRSKYFKGTGGDCVTRAIAIATGKDYMEIYNKLSEGNQSQRKGKHEKKSKAGKKSALNGISTKRKWFKDYMIELGFEWIPTMFIGQGCKVHLHKDELPKGVLVISLSRHLTCVIDGIIYDIYNPQRGSEVGMKNGVKYIKKEIRCVYGYWILNN